MVDTVAVVIPVGPEMRDVLTAKTGRRVGLDASGRLEWDHPRIGSLPGSYDPNIWVQLYEGAERVLRVEGSVHRHILGHNVHGGPHLVVPCGRYLVHHVGRWLGVELPSWESWRLQRLDLAWVLEAGTEDAAYRFIRDTASAWNSSTAIRSAPRSFSTSVYSGPCKLYSKGAEVRKHRPRWMTDRDFDRLLGSAVSKVRFEVTFRRRDIERLTYSNLGTLDQAPLVEAAGSKMDRFGRTSGEHVETVRTIETVTARLAEHYTPARASALMGTWFRLSTVGEQATRDGMTRRTYFRHVAELRAAGVTWTGTDVIKLERPALPEGFALSRWSPYCLTAQAPEVVAALEPFGAAA